MPNKWLRTWFDFGPIGLAPRTLFVAAAALILLLFSLGWTLGKGTGVGFVAMLLPVILAVRPHLPRLARSRLYARDQLVAALDQAIRQSARKGSTTGVLMVEIDEFRQLEERFDRQAVDHLLDVTSQRLIAALRDSDVAARLEGAVFAVALSPARRLDLEAAIQLSTRIQHALAEPIAVGGMNAYVTVSVGFCLGSRLLDPTGDRLLQAATSALVEAQRYSPGAVRSYSTAMQDRITGRSELSEQVHDAIERGEICAFFQPQISARSGAITGFEALARWHHPRRGVIPPIEFLPALEQAGMMDQLGGLMVRESLGQLAHWDAIGLDVPQVGVNFSTEELRDPRLVEIIANALQAHELAPSRLVIEVLETVVANHADDIVLRNLSGLAELGCKLDLDDFGTGHASITSIRRFSVERIKIDRSFVTRIDEDAEQQKMVGAILTMAERLGLDTLAEGVETEAEREMLAGLGCGHVQGFGISRPLPAAETDDWIRSYRGKTDNLIPFRRSHG